MERNVKLFSLAVGGSVLGVYLLHKYQTSRPRLVGTVTGLFIHPLKSGRGIELKHAFADHQGFVANNGLGDRVWAIKYTHNDVKVSARECHQLFKIEVCINKDNLVEFTYPKTTTLILPLPNGKSDAKIHIWGIDVDGEDCGDLAAQWATEIVGKPCRMVASPRNRHLRANDAFRRNWRLKNVPMDADLAGFQDGYPFMTLGEDSLCDINAKIDQGEYTMRTFRPNIVIKSITGTPWAEDNWRGVLKIGSAEFAIASPQPRCIMTTVDPNTCERDRTGEPLKSLKKWRQASGQDRDHLDLYKTMPMVGMNTVLIKRGTVAVGDEIVLHPC